MNKINAVRFTPWIPAMVLPKHALTEEQEDEIISAAKELRDAVNDDRAFMVSTLDGEQFIDFPDISNSYDIIVSAFGYYTFGILQKETPKGMDFRKLNGIKED